MFDFFTGGNNFYEYPSFEVAIYSLLLSLALSIAMAYTYKLTYPDKYFSNNLFQAMVLSSLVTSMIMMAVGNNIAVGFGIIGAVAIIRFRTNMQNPRNIIFMFGALSIGITTGVQGYAVSVAGTIIFCLTAFLLRKSSFGNTTENHYEIQCDCVNDDIKIAFEQVLQRLCTKYELTKLRQTKDQQDRYTYTALFKSENMQSVFVELRRTGAESVQINSFRRTDQL